MMNADVVQRFRDVGVRGKTFMRNGHGDEYERALNGTLTSIIALASQAGMGARMQLFRLKLRAAAGDLHQTSPCVTAEGDGSVTATMRYNLVEALRLNSS